jgi:hypothetical protein
MTTITLVLPNQLYFNVIDVRIHNVFLDVSEAERLEKTARYPRERNNVDC